MTTMELEQHLAAELSLPLPNVKNALQLLREGGTVPFIARYRKERTGGMDEVQLHALFDRYAYLQDLRQRKAVVIASIEKQGKLTDALRAKIEACLQKTELEDLYLPYRPKKRTRATVAREQGLEPLAAYLRSVNVPETTGVDLQAEAARFISPDKGVATADAALAGAKDILAEEIAETAAHRAAAREFLLEHGVFVSAIAPDRPQGSTKYEMYRNFKAKAKEIHPHNMLALLRGEKEGIVTFDLTFPRDEVLALVKGAEVHAGDPAVAAVFDDVITDAFDRLMRGSLVGEIRTLRKEAADRESIRTFEANLRQLLLAAPAGMKPTLGVDPGLRTGCKIVVLDATGRLLAHETIFPHLSAAEREGAAQRLADMITRHEVELIAVGNGTGGRETEEFVVDVIGTLERQPVAVLVNEAGASVYSASQTARQEFPELDVTVRGAVSIGRRLQDPLAELVKIDPKSIGVGQYQHDVDQKLLRKRLDETVESCVNYVGVDVNTASRELLKYVAGVNSTLARSIVTFRDEHGPFQTREELKQVPKFGPKTFEQAAGFLRVRSGVNPLDNSAVHPESYALAERILADIGSTVADVAGAPERLRGVDVRRYVSETAGEPTIKDILAELQKPGRDPRAQFTYATFKEGVKQIADLTPGMELEGVVTNVTNFGAFVDIGVHQDGLVHVSQVADRYVADPKSVVHVGQVVHVRVLEVNPQLHRISLSMKSKNVQGVKRHKRHKKGKPPEKPGKFTIEDLKRKFSER